MTGPGIQEKAIEAIVIMNTAIINLRLYPPTNAMIMKTIDRLHDTLGILLREEDTLLLAESERNLLISGEPLSQKNQEKPQVAIFLMLMINWGIKSLGFKKNLDKSELSLFLEIMGKKPDDVKKEKGLEQLIAEGRMPNIEINQKIYVEMGKDREIVASLDIKDEDIIKYIMAEDPDTVLAPENVKEMAKDPEWVSRIFKSGMRHLVDKDAPASNAVLSEAWSICCAFLIESRIMRKRKDCPSLPLNPFQIWTPISLPRCWHKIWRAFSKTVFSIRLSVASITKNSSILPLSSIRRSMVKAQGERGPKERKSNLLNRPTSI